MCKWIQNSFIMGDPSSSTFSELDESPLLRSTRFRVRLTSLWNLVIYVYYIFKNVSSINADTQQEIQGIFVSSTVDTNLISSVRRRVQISKEKVKTGSLKVLSAKYEVSKSIYILQLINFCWLF